MAKQKTPQVSPPLPFEQIQETQETPDIAAFRAYEPSTAMLQPALSAKFDRARSNIRDSYGAYTGIPSQVVRNQMRDEALQEVDESEGLALAEGNAQVQALKLAQLEALANFTARRKQSGFNTQAVQQQGGSSAAGLINAGANVAYTAAIIA